MGKLYLEGKCRRCVPPIGERKRIVLDVAQQLGYPSGHRLMQVLASRYYWKGMAIDCQRWCAQVLPMQMDQAHFRDPPLLLPTAKAYRKGYRFIRGA